jgi:hypothetical protein
MKGWRLIGVVIIESVSLLLTFYKISNFFLQLKIIIRLYIDYKFFTVAHMP